MLKCFLESPKLVKIFELLELSIVLVNILFVSPGIGNTRTGDILASFAFNLKLAKKRKNIFHRLNPMLQNAVFGGQSKNLFNQNCLTEFLSFVTSKMGLSTMCKDNIGTFKHFLIRS